MFYKHIAFKDVAVEVLKKYYIKEKDMYSIKIRWWNVCPSHRPRNMGFVQRIKVDRKTWLRDWKYWKEGDWHIWKGEK